jgi:hypothetical protein
MDEVAMLEVSRDKGQGKGFVSMVGDLRFRCGESFVLLFDGRGNLGVVER